MDETPASTVIPVVDRETAAPFLVRAFVKTGGFHRTALFDDGQLPTTDERQIFTWRDATLKELIQNLRLTLPPSSDLRHPLARFSFRALFLDTVARTRGGPHYQSKDLGHIAARDSYYATDHNGDDGVHAMVAEPPFEWDRPAFRGADRTLDELKFFPGDLLCVAVILPKSRHEKDASSAPAGAVPSSLSQPPAGVNGAKWGHVADREPAGARGGGPGWRGGASAGAGAGAGRGRGGGRGGGRASSPPPPRRFSPPPPPPASSARGGRGRGRGGFDRGGRFGNGDGGGSGGGGDRARSRSRSRSRSRDRAPLNRDRDRDDRDRRPPLNRERDLDRDRDRRRSRSRSPPPVPSRRR